MAFELDCSAASWNWNSPHREVSMVPSSLFSEQIDRMRATLRFLVVARAMHDGDTMLKKLLARQQSPVPALAAAGVAVAPLRQ